MLHTSLDLHGDGKRQGFLQVPYSHNRGGWANGMVPITVIARGRGPTVKDQAHWLAERDGIDNGLPIVCCFGRWVMGAAMYLLGACSPRCRGTAGSSPRGSCSPATPWAGCRWTC